MLTHLFGLPELPPGPRRDGLLLPLRLPPSGETHGRSRPFLWQGWLMAWGMKGIWLHTLLINVLFSYPHVNYSLKQRQL